MDARAIEINYAVITYTYIPTINYYHINNNNNNNMLLDDILFS